MPNRLADELSPYLLQHAGNPVDWRPWNAEALELARREQKPIFLSIGYSSCHWCHVMAHESFEDAEIARLLNEHFVSIKVDREERPDLDQVYMEAVQMIGGRGGWPMSMFLTPDQKPFFGGTYWPPRPRGGIPGFDQVLQAVSAAWQNHRAELLDQADKITQALQQISAGPGVEALAEPVAPDNALADRRVRETHQPVPTVDGGAFHAPYDSCEEILQEAEAALRSAFDPQFGGFGPAPKFPQPLALRWLLHRWRQSGDVELLRMVAATLDGMAAGGMCDQLGGGFHRYSVDARWLVPHFEKMLYDNALLAVAYLEAWQATGNAGYAAVVRQTLDYVLRDLSDPRGGFYGSEDADSEGEEGKFYLWTPAEIESVLGAADAEAFCRAYDVTESGNYEGRNILNVSGALHADFADARLKLFAARQHRVRPGRDEKVLANWNGLAIDALARAGTVLDEPRYTAAAAAAADFVMTCLRRNDGRLLHYWRAGQAKHDAYLDDYAACGNAMLTLHEADGQRKWLDEAIGMADQIRSHFADAEQGGFYSTAADGEPLIVRTKDALDNPLPSGNGLAAMLLARLAKITGRMDYRAAADATLAACLPWMRQMPTGTFQLLLTLDADVPCRPA